MQLAQKLLSTISMDLESKNKTLAVEVLRDIKYFFQQREHTELDTLLNKCVDEILSNYKEI